MREDQRAQMKPNKEHIMNNSGDRPSPIAELNDDLRRLGRGGRIMITQGVLGLGEDTRAKVLHSVRRFDAFDKRNDPYGEHDCVIVEVEGHSILWKIDYYDTTLTMHSPDPADPDVTCRVLTIMLADEY